MTDDTIALPVPASGMTLRTREAAYAVLSNTHRGRFAWLAFLGPAFIASVAYVDPGNFATNIQAGSAFGYRLLWVVTLANGLAMLFQALSAKLGIVTGQNLAELCRAHLPPALVWCLWIASEIAAMATDVAEFLGATIALNLLFGIPMLIGAGITGIATYAMLALDRYGFRPLEALIATLVTVLGGCYVVELVLVRPDWGAIAVHAVMPMLGKAVGGVDPLTLVMGIVGATIMPHAIFLHSSLTQSRVRPRNLSDAKRLVRFSHREVMLALGLAGAVNLAMMVMAAAAFSQTGQTDVATIEGAYQTLVPLLGSGAAVVFGVALLASGLSSSAVGTLAGQVVMQGFVNFAIPLWLRRLITMAPTLVIIAWGLDTTQVLVMSQVVLSLVLPAPIIALVWFTSRPAIMGPTVNRRSVTLAASAAGALILLLNGQWLWATISG